MTEQVLIDQIPDGPLAVEHFALDSIPTPSPDDGEVLVGVRALTIGAGQRAGLQGSASYAGAPTSGLVMGGTGVGVVLESKADGIAAGQTVVGPTGWATEAVVEGRHLRVVDEPSGGDVGGVDPALHLGVLGTNGLTAYFGLLSVGEPSPGDTVVVSAAAGSVGHIVGQLAKVRGCRVVGVAGSDEKCRLLIDDLGFDAALNRRSSDFRAEFKDATPDRIDVYFDNTGGEILGSALFRMATHGRIVCCGAVSAYDTADPGPSPRGIPGLLVNNRVRMEGFLVFDFADRYAEARDRLTSWIDSGELRPRHVEYQGLAAAPGAFVDLLAGDTVGTVIVRTGSG